MEVILCSSHSENLDASNFLSQGTLHHVPPALLHTLALTREQFQYSIMHTEITNSIHKKKDRKVYERWVGKTLIRHPKTTRTTMLPFTTDTMSVNDTIYAYTRMVFDGWCETEELNAYLGHLECRLRTDLVPFRTLLRKDEEFVVVPISHLPLMTSSIREGLIQLQCQFGINVSFPTEPKNTATFRCLLLPLT